MAGESRPRVAHHCDSSLAPSDRAAAIPFNLSVLAGMSIVLTVTLKNRCINTETLDRRRGDVTPRRGLYIRPRRPGRRAELHGESFHAALSVGALAPLEGAARVRERQRG
jgi:hypothetical protein